MSHLTVLPQTTAVCRLDPRDEFPSWLPENGITALVRTAEELSVVCDECYVPDQIKAEKGWRILKVRGPLEFFQTGILSAIAMPLARAGISIFAISTFDTDYILIKDTSLTPAINTLQAAGHTIEVV